MKAFTLSLLVLAFQFNTSAQVNLTSNLRVCMPFDGNANDLSGNNNNGTISGAITPTVNRFNVANKAYSFTGGLTDYIAISSLTNVTNTNELSISMWAKVNHQTSTCLFQLNPDNGNDRLVGCAQYSGVGLIWDYGDLYTIGRQTASTNWDTQWHHYVFLVSQSLNKKEIYMDGVVKASSAYTGSLLNRNFPVYIGAGTSSGGGGSLRWNGSIDEVLMYNRPLNAQEIMAIFNGSNPCGESIPTGMPENFKSNNSVFFPSPTVNGKLYYAGNYSELQLINVYGLDGRLVASFQGDSAKEVLDLSTLENGVYLMKTTGENINLSQRIIVQK